MRANLLAVSALAILVASSGCVPQADRSWDAQGQYEITPDCSSPPCPTFEVAFRGPNGGSNELDSPQPFDEVHVDCATATLENGWVGFGSATNRALDFAPGLEGTFTGASIVDGRLEHARVLVLHDGIDYVTDDQSMQDGQAPCSTVTFEPEGSTSFRAEFDCPDLRTEIAATPGRASAMGSVTLRGCDQFM